MIAIVTAGGVPQPGEPLYEETLGKPKAMLDIWGKPMVQWVLDAVCQASLVDRIILVGLDESSGVSCPKLDSFLPSHGGLLHNVYAGIEKALEINPEGGHVLYVSSDIPAITPEMVDWVISETMKSDHDAYYNVISRQTMEARYPNSRRSYTRFKDVEVCGGDMNVLRTLTVTGNDELWERIVNSRKSALKQAALIGYDTLFLLLFRLITMDQAVRMVTRRLKISGRVLLCPYAEIGMDVDKPNQLEMVRADLAPRVPA